MIRRQLTILLGLVVFCLASSRLDAQSGMPPPDFYTSAVRSVTFGFRPVMCPAQPEPARSICFHTQINVVPTWGFMADARNDRGTDVVDISAGVGQVFDMMDGARTVSQIVTGGDKCFESYLIYYLGVMADNTERRKLGEELNPSQSLMDFAQDHPECRGIDARTAAEASSRDVEGHARGVEAGIVFIILHEIGHVVHGDPAKNGLSLEQHRAVEMAADDFAIDAAIRANQIISVSMAPVFVAMIQGNTLDWERNSDHPLGIRRWNNFLVRARNDYDANPAIRQKLGDDYEPMIKDLDRQIAFSDRCMARIESGASGC